MAWPQPWPWWRARALCTWCSRPSLRPAGRGQRVRHLDHERGDGERIERSGNSTDYVQLTFDDGASEAQLRSILGTLKRHNVRGTIFFRGDWASNNPSLFRLIGAEGHRIANYTYDHPALSRMSDASVVDQIRRGTAATTTPKLLRPPFAAGAFTNRLVNLAASRGYTVCRWTADTYAGTTRAPPSWPSGCGTATTAPRRWAGAVSS